MGWRRFPLHQRRVAPKVFKAVERALVPVKNVNNHLQIIEHHPLTARKAVNRNWTNCMLFSQPCLNFVCDCFQLRLRRGRAKHEEIGERGNCAQIQNDGVLRLFVRREFCAVFC
jgi:hypothetical protein